MYNIFIALYRLGIQVAAWGGGKPKDWVDGRKQLWAQLAAAALTRKPLIWVHSASAGEFEQAKPVIEALKKDFPAYLIVVTFFSPSGYSVGKKSKLADYVFYLPLDTERNAKRLISLLAPQLVIFIKYDYWYHHLKTIHESGIPLLLVSAIFRPNQAFFKWYGGFYRKMLHFFNHLFVQDNASKNLLAQHGVQHVTVSGDTRFDRVSAIAKNFTEIEGLRKFIQENKVVVAGSTWPEDEAALQKGLETFKDVKLVIAPHEINREHISALQKIFPDSITYSSLKAQNENVSNSFYNKRVLIIDNIGMLSRLYKYADITYIGGGFNKSGIHNTLEAAVWGKPVVWGPNFQKFREAKELLAAGGGFSYSTTEDLKELLDVLLYDNTARASAGAAAAEYVQQNKGATEKVMAIIQEKRLLTKP